MAPKDERALWLQLKRTISAGLAFGSPSNQKNAENRLSVHARFQLRNPSETIKTVPHQTAMWHELTDIKKPGVLPVASRSAVKNGSTLTRHHYNMFNFPACQVRYIPKAAIPNLRCHCEPRTLFPGRRNIIRRLGITRLHCVQAQVSLQKNAPRNDGFGMADPKTYLSFSSPPNSR